MPRDSLLTRLALQPLEPRDVPAYVAVLGADNNVVFTGDASADVLVISTLGNGQLVHNRFAAGDAGFASGLDFDSTQAGVQVFSNLVSDNGEDRRVRVTDTGSNDIFRFETNVVQDAKSSDLLLTLTGGKLDSSDAIEGNLGAGFHFDWDATLAEVQLQTSEVQSEQIDVNGAAFANQTIRISTGGGNDSVQIGGDLDSLDAIAGTIRVELSNGDDLLRIDDALAIGGGRTYTLTADSTTRVKAGLPTATIIHEEGDIENYFLVGSDNPDVLNVQSGPILSNGTPLTQFTIVGNGGADTFNVKPDAIAKYLLVGGGPAAAPGDVLNLDLTGTSIVSQGNVPNGKITFDNRADIDFSQIETINTAGGGGNTGGIGYTAAMDANGNVVFTGSASVDILEVTTDSDGNYRHNRFEEGDPGFVNSADFDSTQPGEQSFSGDGRRLIGDTETIRVTDPGRNDAFTFDLGNLLSDNAFNVRFAGTAVTGTLNGFEVNGDNSFGFIWDDTLAEIRYLGADGSDGIDILRASFANQTIRINTLFGDDSLAVGGDGTTDAIVSPIHFSGFVGTDSLFFADQNAVGGGRTYTITGNSTTRSKAGLPDAVVFHDVGDIENYRFLGSENPDVINIQSVIRLADGSPAANVEFDGRGGADVFNAKPDTVTPFSIDGDAPVVEPGDIINLDLAGTSIVSQGPLPAGAITFTNRATINYQEVEAINNGGIVSPPVVPPVVPPPPVVSPVVPQPVAPGAGAGDLLAVATGPGAPGAVRVFNADGSTRFDLVPFAGFTGGVSVATGDVTGDGIDDVVVGAGAGAVGGHVKVFDGVTGAEVWSFLAFDGFSGGVTVAAGDLDGDGRAEVVVGAGAGAFGGHVKAFDGATGAEVRSFFAFDGFDGGVNVASGDVTGDGRADIVVGAARHVSHVKVFDGASGAEARSFFAFDGPTDGVSVGTGDMNGDGFAEVVVGQRVGGSRVRTFDGQSGANRFDFEAFAGFAGGVSVAGHDRDGDGRSDIAVGAGPAGNGHTKVFSGLTAEELASFLAFDGGSLAPVVVG